MKEKLTNNWGLKLVSVALAMFMWLLVINETHPMMSKTLTVRNVNYLNEDVVIDSGRTFSVDNLESKGISVTVQVRQEDANKVRPEDFQIVVDLAQVGPYGAVEIDVQWLGSDQYKIEESDISWRTTTVTVTLEDIVERNYPVQISIVGEPAEGYIIGEERKTDPRVVTIKAPQSVMERIRSVGIEVSAEGQNSELTGTASLILYDVVGEKLNLDYADYEDYEFSLSQEMISYTVPLLKTKEVGLHFEGITGEVAEGYRFTDVLGANQKVHIAGLKAVLADIVNIEIPAEVLNLEGARENVEVRINVSEYLPEGITVEGESVLTLTLVVEPLIQQTRQLLPEQIRMENGKDGWNYTIRNSVEVVIEGLEEDLNSLTNEDLNAWLSLEGMEPGSNTATVNVTVENGFTLIRIGEASVTMTEQPKTEESGSASDENPGSSGGNGSQEESESGSASSGSTEESSGSSHTTSGNGTAGNGGAGT